MIHNLISSGTNITGNTKEYVNNYSLGFILKAKLFYCPSNLYVNQSSCISVRSKRTIEQRHQIDLDMQSSIGDMLLTQWLVRIQSSRCLLPPSPLQQTGHTSIHPKRRFLRLQNSADNLNFPQKYCLRTRAVSRITQFAELLTVISPNCSAIA